MKSAPQRTALPAPVRSRPCLLAAAALGAVLLASCEDHRRASDTLGVGLGNPELRHPIQFSMRRVTLDVEVPVGAEGLSPNQHVDVYRFLERFKRDANGRLVIAVPASPPHVASMAQSLKDIQRKVVEAGVDYRLLSTAKQAAADVPAIRLAYQHPVAVPPVCDKWGENVAKNRERVPYPNFGCSTQHNLAVMVDNSRDLQRAQDEDPRAGERRSVTWSGYVSGGKGGDGDGASAAGNGDTAKKPAIGKK
jgi:pilus assembly protein CpaD